MSRINARLLPLVLALGLAACSNPTAPAPAARTVQPGSAAHDEICRNGYNISQGVCY
ncbi:MAG: hypothetical protein JWN53_2403 [Gemmatimonadetes bacterium]|nr:hypothetical protein [Gemmatimonadota bacterium]